MITCSSRASGSQGVFLSRILGRDGLVAYDAGGYARRKLDFVRFYCPHAIDATKRKTSRVYIDLFAGPGLNVLRTSKEEVEGGVLQVLQSRGHLHPELSFTHAHLVNLDTEHHTALQSRVAALQAKGLCMVPPGDVRFAQGDANALVQKLMAQCHPLDYVLVFADIEAPRQLPWTTVAKLGADTHKSVDLYLLHPLEMGVNRLTGYRGISPANAQNLTRFYGDESWRPILDRRVTEAQSAECMRQLEQLYLDKLKGHWATAIRVMQARLGSGDKGLYRMIFATNHEAGLKLAKWAQGQTEATDQGRFEGF